MAIAVDNTSSGRALAGTECSWSHTIGSSGANAVLYVGGGSTAGVAAAITGVTYNGDALTQFDDESGTNTRGSVWRLMNPDVGTANVVVTYAAFQDEMGGCSVSLTGVDDADPDDTPVASNGNSATDPSNNVSSASGDLVLDFMIVNHGGAITPDSSQNFFTAEEEEAIGGSTGCGMSGKAGAGTVTMTWTCEWPWVHLAWNVNAFAGGGGDGGSSTGMIVNITRRIPG